jgi:hypothetical protein
MAGEARALHKPTPAPTPCHFPLPCSAGVAWGGLFLFLFRFAIALLAVFGNGGGGVKIFSLTPPIGGQGGAPCFPHRGIKGGSFLKQKNPHYAEVSDKKTIGGVWLHYARFEKYCQAIYKGARV